jgi:serine phosphatase RsbU (regulator of sigma subunit)/ABC-type amino acid transport substrate-binding protein/anti-sigma regulatory factor (Ser/Thr protein kinase)
MAPARWAALLALVVVLTGPAPLGAATTIRVGTYDNPPLIFRDAQGKAQGIYVDVLEHVARQEDWTLQYVEATWEQCLERLRRGEIDLLVAIADSEERTTLYDFSREPFIVNWAQVYVRPGSGIRSLLDLTGRPLAVVRGDIYYDSLLRTHTTLDVFPTFVEVSGYRDALRLVTEGRADAALVPRIFGAFAERDHAVEKTSILFKLVELRFAAPKGRHAEILAALDRRLVALKADKRSVYHRSLGVWLEGVRWLVFPKWLNPWWVVGGVVSTGAVVAALALLFGWLVRARTRALRASLARQAKIDSELAIARNIQMSFVPRSYPPLPGWEIHGELRPARQVGGDFYDCFLLDDGRLYFVLGDVSDKGVPAALFMAVTKTLLAASAARGNSPAVILDHANRQTSLVNNECMFVTAFCGVLDPATGRVIYTNAGHDAPLVLRAGGGVELLESGRAPALCIAEDPGYSVCDIILAPGDTLFMYTDGVTEAMDRTGALFSEKRLRAAFTGEAPRNARGLAATALEAVAKFTGDVPPNDDIAVLVVRRAGERLRLRRRLPEIDRLAEEVARLGREHALADEVVFDLRLALEEAVSNVIRHGPTGREDGEILLGLDVTPEAVTATVEDDGAPFDPLAEPDPPDASAGRGLGVLLMKRVMDDVDYRRQGARNVLTLTKRIGRPICR